MPNIQQDDYLIAINNTRRALYGPDCADIGYTITNSQPAVAPAYPALHDQFDRIEAKLNKILTYLEIEEK